MALRLTRPPHDAWAHVLCPAAAAAAAGPGAGGESPLWAAALLAPLPPEDDRDGADPLPAAASTTATPSAPAAGGTGEHDRADGWHGVDLSALFDSLSPKGPAGPEPPKSPTPSTAVACTCTCLKERLVGAAGLGLQHGPQRGRARAAPASRAGAAVRRGRSVSAFDRLSLALGLLRANAFCSPPFSFFLCVYMPGRGGRGLARQARDGLARRVWQ